LYVDETALDPNCARPAFYKRRDTDMTISVVVPTYRRMEDLRRCLTALAQQSRPADEIIVVVRTTDSDTVALLAEMDTSSLPLRIVTVAEPGQVQALNAGLAAAQMEIVAITDDDAAPHADWIARLVRSFEADPRIGGVGGRDRMFIGGVLQEGQKRTVGKVPRVGRHVGNHHLGFGPPREVDVLKGVNGAYRTVAIKDIGFDTRLLGSGAQVHWEIALGLAVKGAGWKLVYDPEIVVDHYLAKRFDEDQRNSFNAIAMHNMAYNEMFVRGEPLSKVNRALLLAWALSVGTKDSPGIVQWLRFVGRDKSLTGAKLKASMLGRIHAWNVLLNPISGAHKKLLSPS
jgi:GT2 family glycosyltransferase